MRRFFELEIQRLGGIGPYRPMREGDRLISLPPLGRERRDYDTVQSRSEERFVLENS